MQLPGDLQAMTMREALYKALNNVEATFFDAIVWSFGMAVKEMLWKHFWESREA